MRWFRSRSRLGSWLALFALAFQLAVSFAHVHVNRLAPGAGHPSVLSGVHASTGAHTASLPASDEIPALADNFCTICALIHLAGTVVAGEPPSLPLPAVFGRLRSEAAVEFGLTAPNHSRFAARAPPTA
jgi:Protein of unknown function (DUF2946)